MAFLPWCETLFPLSDDLSEVEVLDCATETPDGGKVVQVPHGFLSAKGLDFFQEMPEFPTEATH